MQLEASSLVEPKASDVEGPGLIEVVLAETFSASTTPTSPSPDLPEVVLAESILAPATPSSPSRRSLSAPHHGSSHTFPEELQAQSIVPPTAKEFQRTAEPVSQTEFSASDPIDASSPSRRSASARPHRSSSSPISSTRELDTAGCSVRPAVAIVFGASPFVSPELAGRCEPYVLCVARNFDYIGRLSVFGCDKLVLELTERSAPAMAKQWLKSVFSSSAAPSQAARNRAFGDKAKVADMLLPPGQVLHLDKRQRKPGRGDPDVPRVYRPLPGFYVDMYIHPWMFHDHIPIGYVEDLLLTIRQIAPEHASKLFLKNRAWMKTAERSLRTVLETILMGPVDTDISESNTLVAGAALGGGFLPACRVAVEGAGEQPRSESSSMLQSGSSSREAMSMLKDLLVAYVGKRSVGDVISIMADPSVPFRLGNEHQTRYFNQLEAFDEVMLTSPGPGCTRRLPDPPMNFSAWRSGAMHSVAQWLLPTAALAGVFARAAYGGMMCGGKGDNAHSFIGGAAAGAFGKWDNLAHLNAFVDLAGARREDVVLSSWNEEPYQPAFVLFWVHRLRWLVLTVRGSSELKSVMTDISADTVEICGGQAHSGMVRSARWIVDQVSSSIDRALATSPGYTILCTGHSLGGDVAVLVAMLLREGDGMQLDDFLGA